MEEGKLMKMLDIEGGTENMTPRIRNLQSHKDAELQDLLPRISSIIPGGDTEPSEVSPDDAFIRLNI